MIQWTWMHSTDILGGDCIYKTIRTATFLLLPFLPNMSPWPFTNDYAIVMIDMTILPDQNEIYFWSLSLPVWMSHQGNWSMDNNIRIIMIIIVYSFSSVEHICTVQLLRYHPLRLSREEVLFTSGSCTYMNFFSVKDIATTWDLASGIPFFVFTQTNPYYLYTLCLSWGPTIY